MGHDIDTQDTQMVHMFATQKDHTNFHLHDAAENYSLSIRI